MHSAIEQFGLDNLLVIAWTSRHWNAVSMYVIGALDTARRLQGWNSPLAEELDILQAIAVEHEHAANREELAALCA